MIVDQIGMVGLQTMAKINNRCKVARSLSPDSLSLNGRLLPVPSGERFTSLATA